MIVLECFILVFLVINLFMSFFQMAGVGLVKNGIEKILREMKNND